MSQIVLSTCESELATVAEAEGPLEVSADSTTEEAGTAALDFVARSASGPGDLVHVEDGAASRSQGPLAPALALAWLPTLPGAAKRRLLAALDEGESQPEAAPSPADLAAASALARWRLYGDRAELRRRAVALLAEHRVFHDPARNIQILHPVLLAARLAGLRFDRTVGPSGGGWLRRRQESVASLVDRHLGNLVDFLLDGDVEGGTESCPSSDLLLCLATELWRETVPYAASVRAPLEILVWNRWRRERDHEPRSTLDAAALLVAAENLHIDIDLAAARQRVAARQAADGGFSAAPWMRRGRHLLGARSLSAIIAARALLGQPRTGGAWIR